jgi:hypothetical protein
MKLDARTSESTDVERFRLRFQQRLTDHLLREGSAAEGFGLMWEKTLEEIPVDEEAQGDLYQGLINWVKSDELFATSQAIHRASLHASRGELLRAMRQARLVEVILARADRGVLETRYGQVWDPWELTQEFSVLSFSTPYVIVCRRSDGALGSFEFQADPRFYFNFELGLQRQATRTVGLPPRCEFAQSTLPGRTPTPPLDSSRSCFALKDRTATESTATEKALLRA